MGALRKDKFTYLKNDQMLEDDNVYVVASSEQLNPILKPVMMKKYLKMF